MIRRARPKFLLPGMIEVAKTAVVCEPSAGFYFNRGSAALRFLLECVATRLRRPPRIAMQSFNCISVLDAVLEAGCNVTLCDIKPDDLSLSLQSLATASSAPDVVLLLHYQGLRNAEHREIAGFCRERGILLVEDLAHCTGKAFPLLGEFGIFSFAFDKPFTCLAGGELVHGSGAEDLLEVIMDRYARLPIEAPDATERALDYLELRMRMTATRNYAGADLSEAGFELLVSFGRSIRKAVPPCRKRPLVNAFNAMGRVRSRVHRTGGAVASYAPVRLRSEKIELVAMQRREHARCGTESAALGLAAATLLRDAAGLPAGLAEWNRLSVLEPTGQLAVRLVRAGVEARNYNWPVPLHSSARDARFCLSGDCRQSEHASRNIVNIPVWTPEALPAIGRAIQGWDKA